ncbi:ribonuclease Z isoform X2 [Leptinotarsa decemlineata]|uniref:ribonuclease Z isoform X2 n=1 Tax=Leptinotarsa decemlineata TaxID=7539 RepID=UPI003D308BCF
MIIFLKLPLFSQRTVLHLKLYSTLIHSKLHSVLKNMPKEPKHISEAQKQRRKIKEKFSKYVPGKVTLQVLGTGAKGAPRALYLFTDQSRYLFNCGEGTQRLAHEHKMKLAKLEHIFITQPVWKNIGGLPGTALTIQDVGVPDITLHGPAGLDEIFVATKRFVIIKDLKIHMAVCNEHNFFEDNVMRVEYVPIVRTSKVSCYSSTKQKEGMVVDDEEKFKNSEINAVVDQVDAATSTRSEKPRRKMRSSSGSTSGEETVNDDIDYYAHEHSGSRTSPKPISSISEQILQETKEKGISMIYICKLHPKPGALNLEKCVKMGVPPGPLLGKLKAGENIELPNGNVVSTKDVCEPDDPGPVFVVVDCPTLEYIDSLLSSEAIKRHQDSAKCDEDLASVVVHFTPKEVVSDTRYKQWIDKFSPSTQHIMLNEFNTCMGSESVYRIQYKLNLLSDELFPLLRDKGTQVIREISGANVKKKQKYEDGTGNTGCTQNDLNLDNLTMQSRPASPSEPFVFPNTFCNFHLRPKKGLDRTTELKINPKEYIEETMVLEEFSKLLSELKTKLIQKKLTLANVNYPKILFLGTGSCIPNKTRNTSGILVTLSDSQNIILDCGEGTYGQIVRFFGSDQADKVLANIDAIYVSHLHADHHIGLIGLLQGRRRAIENIGLDKGPAYLFAPNQIMAWLSFYNKCFETINAEFKLVPNGELMFNNPIYPENSKMVIMNQLKMSDIETCLVRHCPNAFGVAFTTENGIKLTYSGDTMPTESLVQLGTNSDILIHEATMEDELSHEAVIKMHSTTSQAIDVGIKMNAKNIILTHFSQRYARLPRFNENFNNNVGVAFDNMQVSLDNVSLLPELQPALKLMFAEHCEELENKALKRQMRLERERSASLDRNLKRKQSLT